MQNKGNPRVRVITGGLGELLSALGGASSGESPKNWRNPVAQEQLLQYRNLAMKRIVGASDNIATAIKNEVVNEVRGLKGALSLIKRVSGKDAEWEFDEDSEVGVMVSDKVKASGMQSKIDRIYDFHRAESIRLDMTRDFEEAINIVADYRKQVDAILDELPIRLKI